MNCRHVAGITLNEESQRGERLRGPTRVKVIKRALNHCLCSHSHAQDFCDDLRIRTLRFALVGFGFTITAVTSRATVLRI